MPRDIVSMAVKNLKASIDEAAASIKVMSNLPTITGNRINFVLLMQNLIGNAVKYRHGNRRPEIRISYTLLLDKMVITVADNGIGFEPQYAAQIFEPFKRLHSNDEYKGSGMGLSICRKVVEEAGGYISASSTPGEGSIFTITLPAGIRK